MEGAILNAVNAAEQAKVCMVIHWEGCQSKYTQDDDPYSALLG